MWIDPKQHKTVGQRLAAARRRAGVTQQQLAAKLGKPQSFVSAYEGGQRRVDVLELCLIATALELNPLALFAEVTNSE